MLAVDLVELGGAEVPGAGIDRTPAFAINLLDRALAVIGGVLVGIVGLVILAAKDRAARQEGQAGPQKECAQDRLQADKRDHLRSLMCAQRQAFSKACLGTLHPVGAICPLYTVPGPAGGSVA